MAFYYIKNYNKNIVLSLTVALLFFVAGCSDVGVPDAGTVNIPAPVSPQQRSQAVNERSDAVMYLPLGEDVLVPDDISGGSLPDDIVGPFELRSETLAGALQLILADYDISIAFETDEGLNRTVTVANLKGPLNRTINRVCGLADLYCSYEEGVLVVKETQTFTVSLPPIGADSEDTDFLDDVAEGLQAILGENGGEPVVDPTTRSIIYTATQRTSEIAEKYFQRLRANTALIVFETYVWEVALNAENSTGINWTFDETLGKFNFNFSLPGSAAATNPVVIGLPITETLGADATPTEFVEFLSTFGAVKTITQPQLAVLSGSSAELRIADTENFVSEITTTVNEGQSTTAVNTDTVDEGFTLTISSSWDRSTVYANFSIEITSNQGIENFPFSTGDGGQTQIQLPNTSERELTTQIRVRPGDSILIAGLVQENDNFNSSGPGFNKPLLPTSRSTDAENSELVILLRPRVVVYTDKQDNRYSDFLNNNRGSTPIRTPSTVRNAPSQSIYQSAPVEPVVRDKTVGNSVNRAPVSRDESLSGSMSSSTQNRFESAPSQTQRPSRAPQQRSSVYSLDDFNDNFRQEPSRSLSQTETSSSPINIRPQAESRTEAPTKPEAPGSDVETFSLDDDQTYFPYPSRSTSSRTSVDPNRVSPPPRAPKTYEGYTDDTILEAYPSPYESYDYYSSGF